MLRAWEREGYASSIFWLAVSSFLWQWRCEDKEKSPFWFEISIFCFHPFHLFSVSQPWRCEDEEKSPLWFLDQHPCCFSLIHQVTEAAVARHISPAGLAPHRSRCLCPFKSESVSPQHSHTPLKWDCCSRGGWMRHDLTLVGDDIDRSNQSLGFV